MKFAPTPWAKGHHKPWNSRREAAARRRIALDQAKIDAAKAADAEEVALFPELQNPTIQNRTPDHANTDERRDAMIARELHLTLHFRRYRAQAWRDARTFYYSLRSTTRDGVRRLWNRGIFPFDPSYLHELIRHYTKPGCSPWTALRKHRFVELVRDGRLPRPARMLDITRDFKTL